MSNSVIKKQISVSLQMHGLHCWPDCNIPEVMFLAKQHRHTFFFKLLKTVGHGNRDIEFLFFKKEVETYLINKYSNEFILNFGSMSCEDIALELLLEFKCDQVEVYEDNENGAIIST